MEKNELTVEEQKELDTKLKVAADTKKDKLTKEEIATIKNDFLQELIFRKETENKKTVEAKKVVEAKKALADRAKSDPMMPHEGKN
jgi:hypothetical protein